MAQLMPKLETPHNTKPLCQKYFCKSVNHLNLFCVLLVKDILCGNSKLPNQTWVGPNWASHVSPSFH